MSEQYISTDGQKLTTGMPVWCIRTRDAGRTWTVHRDFIHRRNRFLNSVMLAGHLGWWVSIAGDNRIYVLKKNASAEARTRTIAGTHMFKGLRSPGYEYWSRRPGKTNYGGATPGRFSKKITHRAERLESKKIIIAESKGCS